MHYGQWRRQADDAEVRIRVSPSATVAERLAAHSRLDGDCLTWTGCTERDHPKLALWDGKRQRTRSARELALIEDGRPKPPGYFRPVPRCDNHLCVNPDHLTWTNRRPDARLSVETVDRLIEEHAAGALVLADVADELGVNRSTVYKAMARRGYRPTRAKAATATE